MNSKIKMQATENVENNKMIRKRKNVKLINNSVSRKVYLFIKNILDIFVGLIGMIILIPLTVIVWIVFKITRDKGPIFYSHTRIGKDGKPFKLHKFRTMYINADEELEKILQKDENLRKEWDENRKLAEDPRITKFGKILRKTSLDEFPNFIEVLTGKMSLIGPRAVVPEELKMFGKYKDEILKVKPGITGYWAANGRSNISYKERVKMETYYARNVSFMLDVKIFFKTIISIISKNGAF